LRTRAELRKLENLQVELLGRDHHALDNTLQSLRLFLWSQGAKDTAKIPKGLLEHFGVVVPHGSFIDSALEIIILFLQRLLVCFQGADLGF
jgi:hypothetical protein